MGTELHKRMITTKPGETPEKAIYRICGDVSPVSLRWVTNTRLEWGMVRFELTYRQLQ